MKSIDAVHKLGALAQESRLDVYRLLVQQGAQGVAAGDIAERCGVPAPTLSFHLAQLRHTGLVTSRRESRQIIYAADYEAMNRLLAFLTENCCGGAAQAPTCNPLDCTPPAASETPAALPGESHETPARARVRR